MNRGMIIAVLVVLLALAGVGGWLLLDDDTGATASDDGMAIAVTPPTDDPRDSVLDPTDDPRHSATRTKALTESDDQPDTKTSATDDTKPDSTQTGTNDNATTPDASKPQPTTKPKPAPRRLTPRQREEKRRRDIGRPAHAKRVSSAPKTRATDASFTEPPESGEWANHWIQRGVEPPAYVNTPIHGKIMSEPAREGYAGAQLTLMSFLPVGDNAGAEVVSVITSGKTDDKGFFKITVPIARTLPSGYPALALNVIDTSTKVPVQVLTGVPVLQVKPGRTNEVGILWAPSDPVELQVQLLGFDATTRVICTGELNPMRWHESARADLMQQFALFAPNAENPSEPFKVIGTSRANQSFPYFAPIHNNAIQQAKRPTPVVVVDKSPPPQYPFETLVFENQQNPAIRGVVVDAFGVAVPNAILTLFSQEADRSGVTDSAGQFRFDNPPKTANSLLVRHEDFIEEEITLGAETGNLVITMGRRKPVIRMRVTDRITAAPITEIGVSILGMTPNGEHAGRTMSEEIVTLTSETGDYELKWDVEIRMMVVEKIGYFPRTFLYPAKTLDESDLDRLEVDLNPGRKIEINPRDYSSVERDDRWFADDNNGPGIRTYWSRHWIEYQIDFGDEPEEGDQGGFFDIILGATNHGIVDNDYEFRVEVYVDGVKKSTLTILANSTHTQTDRAALGKLSGTHAIRLVWLNDKWIPDQLDANIRYASIQFLEQAR